MKAIKNIFKGVVIGIATLVPGVSGGTMAIILGVYDGIIHAISSFFKDWKKHTLLLLQIGIGGIIGILGFSRLLENSLKEHPYAMQYLFIGIIIGGLPVLYKKSKASQSSNKRHWVDYIFFIIGAVLVFLLSSEPDTTTTMVTASGIKGIFSLFVAGFILAVALVLPGISASFMLLALGLYGVTLNAINTVNIPFLVPLLLGVLVGTLTTTKSIEIFLNKYPSKAYMLILGFVVGSLKPVFPGIPTGSELILSIIFLVVGFIAILNLGKMDITE
ncbi:MAG: DUF368 domain-containing protein [Vallitaleaceae bacterium]|nr:DUF368 domain-containing protein [Vallitaleaceae bacterium]